jgi:glycosyltransferase involved in cell wall biosynthesis
VQFHLLSFEGPDAYSRAGGLATRVVGLAQTLADLDFETHLWFIGDPDLPAHETHGPLHYHRWCQWVSKYHPHGVYDGELGKAADYNASLPPYLLREVLLPRIQEDGQAIILAEEWQTVDAVLHLHWLLRYAGLRERVSLLWNANNTFGFERIPWSRLAEAATVTTVSRYMKHRMRELGVDALVVPNGLTSDAFDAPGPLPVRELRRRFRNRTLLTKVARWDPGKRWIATIDLMAEMKRRSWRPLLVARGGSEPYGNEVLAAAHAKGLKIFDRAACRPGPEALLEALDQLDCADVVNLISFVDPESRRLLFRAVDAVLANSGHEPFGLVGLETMAAGGLACTGCSGEDYAVPGQNALVLETEDPHEFMALFRGLRTHPARAQQLRRAGRSTARHYAWPEIVEGVLLPRCELPDTESYESGLPPLQRVRGTAATALRKVG